MHSESRPIEKSEFRAPGDQCVTAFLSGQGVRLEANQAGSHHST